MTDAAAGLNERGATVRGTAFQRLRAGLISLAASIACRLPEPVVAVLARLAGSIWYRTTPARAAQARLNLGRVVRHLAAGGRGGPGVAAAAADPVALERMVRGAYRQAVRYYLDMMRVGAGARLLRGRLEVETPEVVDRALATGGAVVLVGMHFGALELPALYLAQQSGRPIIVPMETLLDPALQAWLVRTRSQAGVRIVGLTEARRELIAAIGRRETVGLIGDRDLTGGGLPIPLFGVPARLPMGPALFAIETGVPVYVGAARRSPGGRWVGKLHEIAVPETGTRRARLTAAMEEIARTFESLIADAPEQWWTLFFPIWDDLVVPGAEAHRPATRAAGGPG
jgi:KDO2-lipid IV(A) lauroyltransferase